MSYTVISVREALDKINNSNNGWFLPQVQRQYVWGVRDESEDYICLLLDSVLKEYPVGGIVLWETEAQVPHREFLRDFKNGSRANEVDIGLRSRNKLLVYDGQQRLQTLYSVLRYTMNDRILCFDLTFDSQKHESDETGFYFIDRNKDTRSGSIRMNSLCAMSDDSKTKERLKTQLASNDVYTEDLQLTIKANLDKLWQTFVQSNTKTLAYFSVSSNNDHEVNEIFRRLNTGGVPLTQSELVLSAIKAKYPSFEGDLDTLSGIVFDASGIEVSPFEILQFIFLMAKETPRVDSDRFKSSDIELFVNLLQEITNPLKDFFEGYLWTLFNINNRSILPRWLALLPIMAYVAERYKADSKYEIKRIPAEEIQLIHQYFILSQLNDWNTQTMVTYFSKEARKAAILGHTFPLVAIRDIAIDKSRRGYLTKDAVMNQPWFSLKIVVPNRQYQFASTKPQIDHIFPKNLEGKDDNYKFNVDVLWNFQPMPAGINNYKRAKHPLSFFGSADGAKYYDQYDFIPDLTSDLWQDEVKFISNRESLMKAQLSNLYKLELDNQ